jgi:hypothetical protein
MCRDRSGDHVDRDTKNHDATCRSARQSSAELWSMADRSAQRLDRESGKHQSETGDKNHGETDRDCARLPEVMPGVVNVQFVFVKHENSDGVIGVAPSQ